MFVGDLPCIENSEEIDMYKITGNGYNFNIAERLDPSALNVENKMSLKHEHKDGNMNNLFRDPGLHGNQPGTHGGSHLHPHMQPYNQGYNQHPPGHPGIGYHHHQQQTPYGQHHPHLGGGQYGHSQGMIGGSGGGMGGNMGGQMYGMQGGGMKMPVLPPANQPQNMNYRQYRESRPRSPTKSSAPQNRGILDEIDDQAAGYKDDRIQNELLKEICSDIGIDDAMDLDIFDFDAPADNYYFPQQTRLSDFGIDQNTPPFADMQAGEEMSKPPSDGGKKDIPDPSITKLPMKTEAGEMSPYTQSVPSVKSADYSREAAVDSPTVSSSVPGNCSQDNIAPPPSGNSGHHSHPDSSSSSLGSPSVHSTTPSLSGPYESLKPPSSVESLKNPSSVDSVSSQSSSLAHQPPILQRASHGRHDSVDSTASCPPNLHKTGSVGSPMSPAVSNTNLGGSHSNMSTKPGSLDNLVDSPGRFSNPDDDVNDRTLVDLTDDQQYTSSFKSDVFTCYSQPASPAKSRPSNAQMSMSTNSQGVYKAQSMNDNLHRHAIHRLHSQHEQTFQKSEKDYEAHTDDQKQKAQSINRAAAMATASSQGEFKVPQDVGKISSTSKHTEKLEKSTSHDQGYSSSMGSQSAESGSHYGSSSNLSHASVPSSTTAPDAKDSKNQFEKNSGRAGDGLADQSDSNLDVFSMPSTADLNIPTLHSDTPSNCSSQSNSPTSMHVAKRARVINSGSDLLEEMRERYSFTKGADMYAPPSQYPQIPVQRVRPTPQMQPSYQTSGVNPTQVPMQTQVPSQFNFSGGSQEAPYPQRFMGPNGNNMNMNNNSQAMTQSMQRRTMYSGNSSNNIGYGQQQGNTGGHVNMQMNMYSGGNSSSNLNNTSHYPNVPAMDMSSRTRLQGQEDTVQDNVGSSMHMNMNNKPMNMQQGGMNMQHHQGRPPVAGARMSANVDSRGQMPYGQGMNYGAGDRGCNSPLSPNRKVYHNMDNSRQFEGGGGPPSQRQYDQSQGNQTQYTASHYHPGVANGNNTTNTGYHGNTNPGAPGHNYRPQSAGNPGYNNSGGNNGVLNSINGGNSGMNMGMNSQMGGGQQFDGGPNMNNNMQMRIHGEGSGSFDGGDKVAGTMSNDSLSIMNRLPRPTPGKLAPPPEGLMQQIISDRSSAFRSHPLFPLLRDLIIADMNFHTPSFPFQLIANLPADFDKLLQNYLNRNPPMRNMQPNPPIEQVIMDALKYAHQSLIEKIQVKKQEVGYQETPKPLSAIEDFCERFDRAVKNSMTPKPSGPLPPGSTSKAMPPKTPTKVPQGGAPVTPKKEPGRESKTDNEKAAGSTPTSKGTAGRNKVLPKEAVALMLDWLREHQDNPYPNDDEKEMLIAKTKLTINQINYWFTNARRRILPKWALQRYMEQQQHSPFGPRLAPM